MTSPQPSPNSYAEALAAAAAAAATANATPSDLPLAMTTVMAEGAAAARERAAAWAKRIIGALWRRVDPYDGQAVQDFTIAATSHMATAQTATARAAAAAQMQILSTMGVRIPTANPSNPIDVRGSTLTMSTSGARVQSPAARVAYSSEPDAVRVASTDMTTQAVLNRPARTYRYLRSQGASETEASVQAARRLDTLIDDNLMLAQRIAETEVLAVAAAPTRRGEDPLDALERELRELPERRFWTTVEEAFADTEDAVPEPVNLDEPAEADGEVIGYRRIYHPELSRGGSCGMCIVAADRLYTIGTLKPIHTNCKCTVAPVTKDHDPGKLLNSEDLTRLYEEGGGTSRRHLKRTRYTVDENGELAAVLVPKAAYKPRDSDKTESARTSKRKTKAGRTAPSPASGTSTPPPKPPAPPTAAAAADDGGFEEQLRLQFARAAAQAREPYMPTDTQIAAARARFLTSIRNRGWDNLTDEQRATLTEALDTAMRRSLQPDVASIVHRTYNLEDVLDSGRFQSQFETDSSQGVVAPEVRALREAAWFGRPGPDDAAPIYGSVEYNDLADSGVAAEAYGDAAVYFRPDVFDRITITVGDSLNNSSTVFPGHPDSDDAEQHMYAAPNRFMPEVDPARSAEDNADAVYEELRRFTTEGHDYIEAQIHQPLLVSDIERVVLNPLPPASLVAKLDLLGIPWEIQK